MPTSSPDVSDDDPTGSDDDTAPDPAPVHAGLTMEQVHANYDAVMADKEQPATAPISVFQQARVKQRYNLFLLEQHRLAEGQIYGERTSK